MTATKSKLESLYAERDNYKKGIESSLKRGVDISNQMKYLEMVESEINEILKQSQPQKVEKKNNIDSGTTEGDQHPPIEHKPNIESNDNSINLVVNIPVSTKGNNKRVEDANKVAHFFDTEDAAKKFQYYNRERLRSKLKSWNKKKHKTKEGKEMMYLVVSYFLAQIEGVINYSAKPEYREALRKKTYSLGESANDKTYCFDMEKLRKDFDF